MKNVGSPGPWRVNSRSIRTRGSRVGGIRACRVLLALAGLCLLGGGWDGPQLVGQEVKPAKVKDGIQIRLDAPAEDDGPAQRFVVTGLSESILEQVARRAGEQPSAWQNLMVVAIATDAADAARPMLGDYRVETGALVFAPRFPLRPGSTYRVTVMPAGAKEDPQLSREFRIAEPPRRPPTRLVAIYPSSDVLPENQLKFYLHFSAPMSRGEAYQRVKLLDQEGRQVDFPFLELGEELWDPTGTRFTLFFDPGRIKRGLQPRELFGPALLEGKSYTLVIDAGWPDAQGRPLAATSRKPFRVVAPDDEQPLPEGWQLVEPAQGSLQPLVVSFGEPLDHAMLQRVLSVRRGDQIVAGRIVISKQESQWSFQPDAPWGPGEHALVVDAALEDLAGNSLGRPFEVDRFDKVERTARQTTVQIPFETRSACDPGR